MTVKAKLTVSYHPQGHFTLSEVLDGEKQAERPGPFMRNPDKADFYRRVAAKLGELAAAGCQLEYKDTTADSN
ncbi:hypothetical protein V5F40_22770 [Xanthobacter sp. DSM 14520]|uniref:hypothetical protein n=1 Tax=Xanthobacter autotrophicus (strain ATCC BAA-1158 / Py2) TaxID=78245 RepID=UPI003727CE3B